MSQPKMRYLVLKVVHICSILEDDTIGSWEGVVGVGKFLS